MFLNFQEPFGSVYCVTNEGVVRVDTGFLFPNGIAVLHDDDGCPKTLIVAETPTKRLWGYDIVGSGKLKNKRIWGQLPGKFTNTVLCLIGTKSIMQLYMVKKCN